jgi:hypothetical protein
VHTLQVGLLLLLIHWLILHGLCEWVHQGWLVGVASHVSSTLLLLHAWLPCREGEVPLAIEENGVVNGEGSGSRQILHLNLKSSLGLSLGVCLL